MKRGPRNPLCLIGIAVLLASFTAFAQVYPSKPVRVVVPFPAGSVPDVVARLATERMGSGLGQPVIVENRIGAGGRIGAEAVARATPDGYTLLFGAASTQVLAPFIVKKMPYDPAKDFTPIAAAVSTVGGVVVNSSVPVNSMRELIDYVRANPGKIAYGSNGIGSAHHLVGELIKMVAGIDMLHVPYQGSNEVLSAALANQIQVTFTFSGAAQQYVSAGRLKVLAVLTPKRFPGLPNIPTLTEVLPGYEPITDWFGFFGPAGLPQEAVARLNGEVLKALNAPDVHAKLDGMTLLVTAGSPDDLATLMRRQSLLYGKLIKALNIPAQ